ncbi:MAG TPA: hypothetical protein VK034_05510 [Enhygromyxa sp.]|nr:hypothetical protein [Enhygromyxa sp.]
MPDYLESAVSMLESAYPDGIPAEDVLPVMRALYDHMSDRGLAKTMGFMLGQDYALLLNRVYEAAQMDESAAPVQAVVRLLERHGYTEWCDEDS